VLAKPCKPADRDLKGHVRWPLSLTYRDGFRRRSRVLEHGHEVVGLCLRAVDILIAQHGSTEGEPSVVVTHASPVDPGGRRPLTRESARAATRRRRAQHDIEDRCPLDHRLPLMNGAARADGLSSQLLDNRLPDPRLLLASAAATDASSSNAERRRLGCSGEAHEPDRTLQAGARGEGLPRPAARNVTSRPVHSRRTSCARRCVPSAPRLGTVSPDCDTLVLRSPSWMDRPMARWRG
jgi:hypothetical protein